MARTKLMLMNGKEIPLDNFDEKNSDTVNKFRVITPAFRDLSAQQRMMMNSLDFTEAGYEHFVTVLTQIKAQVIKQKFYEVNPSDFMPVVTGEGAWMENLVWNTVIQDADDFEKGLTDSSMPNTETPGVDIKIVPTAQRTVAWNRGFNYGMIEIKQASIGNVDVIALKEETRKKNWDLGIQRVAFLGSKTRTDIRGLLTLPSTATNTTFISAKISSLDTTTFQTFVSGLLPLYAANVNNTVLPNRLLIPQSDMLGMASAISSTYPTEFKLSYLERAFKSICGNDFKIVSTVYNNKAQMNTAGSNYDRYMLYRDDPEALEFNVPVPYTTTAFGTADGFNFKNVAFGQFAGVFAKRPLEAMYFDNHSS